MKAVLCTQYGSPDVLQLQEVEKPTAKDNEILIRIHAAVVGPSDCAFRKADTFMIRLVFGLTKPRNPRQGVEFAGEVEAVGSVVKLFKKGDRVFGMSPNQFGAHAEYICLPEGKTVAIQPANATYEDAAAVCDGGLTALTFLRDLANVRSGQQVLINGASGAVGAYAVQLAKYYGAEVTGVCSTANVQLVKSLGADKVVDYTKEDFTRIGQVYDVIFDAVGKSSFSRSKGSLKPNGVYLNTVLTMGILLRMLWTTVTGGKRAKFTTAGLKQNKANFDFLKELVEAGKIKAVIDRRYSLDQISEAHRYVDTGRKKGNVVITLGKPN
ncbi:NAD(P)-dependent alcohol dehydrogenase [Cohnella herbarum]|uniref:NAD(P)-dependent alcohol dehydrogenase n=1 Tax=Cohnella herbarum TaxID=2728023 RepID=A0A7Z2VFA2_9BACL|nr:NAD(P)-dependent alcohol dehydrogenase [Cohnella herbarum]QJD81999.1 NAD(P)-dependent alcohol dehydrogenase [Cohnella herbarum]